MPKSDAEVELGCSHLINTAGAWAADLARLAGVGDPKQDNPVMRVPLPVTPRKRCVFVFKCPGFEESSTPLVIDYSGTFFRRESGESGTFIAGMTPPEVTLLAANASDKLLFCSKHCLIPANYSNIAR